MNVHEESVRFPATLLLDGFRGDSIEMHGHGPTCSEGVAADVAAFITKVEQTNVSSS